MGFVEFGMECLSMMGWKVVFMLFFETQVSLEMLGKIAGEANLKATGIEFPPKFYRSLGISQKSPTV
jgi:hypothetical protein